MNYRAEELRTSYSTVRDRIDRIAESAGRNPSDIELLPVTKFHPVEDLKLLASLGVKCVGENREQEARSKASEVATLGLHIDMIGQIQSNKINHVARWAHRVHTVDSAELARGLDRGVGIALERGVRVGSATIGAFVQWSVDGDPSRGGATAESLDAIADVIAESEHLELAGLMVVPPLDCSPSAVFDEARHLSDRLRVAHGGAGGLSAGMSGDLETAIQFGSTLVRVGTAILGSRPVHL